MLKKAVLLIGSPKKTKSTSEALGTYLLKQLGKEGYTSQKCHLLTELKVDLEGLLKNIHQADLVIISFPLYIDSLPTPLIRTLEAFAAYRLRNPATKEQSLIAIANCGFPEAFHNDTALEICEQFAKATNFRWCGGLSTGLGPAIEGSPLEKRRGLTRHLTKALNKTAESIGRGEKITEETLQLMRKPAIPLWLYLFLANWRWKFRSSQSKANRQLYDTPYLK